MNVKLGIYKYCYLNLGAIYEKGLCPFSKIKLLSLYCTPTCALSLSKMVLQFT